ncbi:hypothetical protein C8A03DRAFT_47691 [Achaetomium macrosporum]|uniref:Protein kinase domain-containing protein n=1 Tax=Achaetomium macrosporum TaxID=79813 RepID=A0AAN7HAA4_9PEZI|nr:hypothetical protein C8A03DRAFT_47691 [Achaetomium macrosporum]
MAGDKHPVIEHWSDLRIYVTVFEDPHAEVATWIHYTAEDEAYMGRSHKDPDNMTLDKLAAGLVRLDDSDIYPEVSAAGPITVAAKILDDSATFIKHCGFRQYPPPKQLVEKGFKASLQKDGYTAKDQLLEKVLVMDKLSKTPHPYIVRYLGCRVHRGYITGIVVERLIWDLSTYATKWPAEFAQLDKEAFLAGIESAVKFLHSLGMAHNDMSPRNIMVREDEDGYSSPVLIDFDSCAAFGGRLLCAGTPDFVDEDDPDMFVSLKRHDEYSLDRLREWWDKQLEGGPGGDEDTEDNKDKKGKEGKDSKEGNENNQD